MLTRVADFLEPMLTQTPARPVRRLWDLWKLGKLGLEVPQARPATSATEAVEILTGAARPILDRWFESEQLKATIATDAVIGAFAPPSHPGTAYVLFHHVMGECNGVRGVWGYVRGGMGMISNSIAAAAKAHGAEIRTNADGRPRSSSATAGPPASPSTDGTEFHANGRRLVRRRQRHVPQADGPEGPAGRVRRGGQADRLQLGDGEDQRGAERAAELQGLPGHRRRPAAPRHDAHLPGAWTTSSGPTTTPSTASRPRNPMLECTMATALDDTLAPPGKHILSMFVQYAPYHLKGTTWDVEKDKFADRCFDILNEYAPNFKAIVIAPAGDPAAGHGAAVGHHRREHHAGVDEACRACSSFRPAAGYADYRTPVRGCTCAGRRPTPAAA